MGAPAVTWGRPTLTSAEINALPDRVRRYIMMLETDADPSGTIRSEMHLRDQVEALELLVQELRGPKPALHFVGFRGDEYLSAVRVWGKPGFIHMGNDLRMRREMAPGDTVIFANGSEAKPVDRNYQDLKEEGYEECLKTGKLSS